MLPIGTTKKVKKMKVKCKTDSKLYCRHCRHYDYCDKANRCYGDCHKCDDYECENNKKKLEKEARKRS